MLLDLFVYRHFVISTVFIELKGRFVRSRFGFIWMIVHPLVQVFIYTFILSSIMSAKLPGIENKYSYPIYLMSGILAWTLFADILNRSLNMFIENANLLKKTTIPKIAIVATVLLSSLLSYTILLIAIISIFAFLGHQVSINILWILPVTILLLLFASGIGLIIGIINVFARDIAQLLPLALQFMFWFTPIVYMPSIIPPDYLWLLKLNPFFWIVTSYQEILLFSKAPSALFELAILSLFSTILMAAALFFLKRANSHMADLL